MHESMVKTSECNRKAAGSREASLNPAICGCVLCGTRQMITMPMLGACETCGTDLQPLASDSLADYAPAPPVIAARRAA